MNTTYAQRQTTAQKKDANTAASVVDSSSQAQSLQRKADLCNSPIQCYGMTDDFREKHSYCSDKIAEVRFLNRGQVNSVLKRGAQNKLNGAKKDVKCIVGVECSTWYYDKNGDPCKNRNDYCAVYISNGDMSHLEKSGPKMAAGKKQKDMINYSQL